LINLADNHEADGSFVIVPGFGKKRFEEWTKSTHTTLGKRFPKQEIITYIDRRRCNVWEFP
jgi:hypothetical protein